MFVRELWRAIMRAACSIVNSEREPSPQRVPKSNHWRRVVIAPFNQSGGKASGRWTIKAFGRHLRCRLQSCKGA